MTRLSQIVAVEKGVHTRAQNAENDAYHQLQKSTRLQGISREYTPRDAEGEQLPGETKKVEITVDGVIGNLTDYLAKWFDVAATKEWGNTHACADIKVEDVVLVEQVPAGYLLFLYKRLVDLRTFIEHLPTLDPAKDWERSIEPGVWVTPEVKTTRGKKIPRNHVRAPATDKHPAQVDVYHEDVVVGDWAVRTFSGEIPGTHKAELLTRVDRLVRAVQFAREEANATQVEKIEVGSKILTYLFEE